MKEGKHCLEAPIGRSGKHLRVWIWEGQRSTPMTGGLGVWTELGLSLVREGGGLSHLEDDFQGGPKDEFEKEEGKKCKKNCATRKEEKEL